MMICIVCLLFPIQQNDKTFGARNSTTGIRKVTYYIISFYDKRLSNEPRILCPKNITFSCMLYFLFDLHGQLDNKPHRVNYIARYSLCKGFGSTFCVKCYKHRSNAIEASSGDFCIEK